MQLVSVDLDMLAAVAALATRTSNSLAAFVTRQKGLRALARTSAGTRIVRYVFCYCVDSLLDSDNEVLMQRCTNCVQQHLDTEPVSEEYRQLLEDEGTYETTASKVHPQC